MGRRFHRRDDAFDVVVAAILLVAAVVAIATGLYVWSGSFGDHGSAEPARVLSLVNDGGIARAGGDEFKNFTVVRAATGMSYDDLVVTLDGTPLSCASSITSGASSWRVASGDAVPGCATGDGRGPTSPIGAGDRIEIYGAGGGLGGRILRIEDAVGNAVLLTMTVG